MSATACLACNRPLPSSVTASSTSQVVRCEGCGALLLWAAGRVIRSIKNERAESKAPSREAVKPPAAPTQAVVLEEKTARDVVRPGFAAPAKVVPIGSPVRPSSGLKPLVPSTGSSVGGLRGSLGGGLSERRSSSTSLQSRASMGSEVTGGSPAVATSAAASEAAANVAAASVSASTSRAAVTAEVDAGWEDDVEETTPGRAPVIESAVVETSLGAPIAANDLFEADEVPALAEVGAEPTEVESRSTSAVRRSQAERGASVRGDSESASTAGSERTSSAPGDEAPVVGLDAPDSAAHEATATVAQVEPSYALKKGGSRRTGIAIAAAAGVGALVVVVLLLRSGPQPQPVEKTSENVAGAAPDAGARKAEALSEKGEPEVGLKAAASVKMATESAETGTAGDGAGAKAGKTPDGEVHPAANGKAMAARVAEEKARAAAEKARAAEEKARAEREKQERKKAAAEEKARAAAEAKRRAAEERVAMKREAIAQRAAKRKAAAARAEQIAAARAEKMAAARAEKIAAASEAKKRAAEERAARVKAAREAARIEAAARAEARAHRPSKVVVEDDAAPVSAPRVKAKRGKRGRPVPALASGGAAGASGAATGGGGGVGGTGDASGANGVTAGQKEADAKALDGARAEYRQAGIKLFAGDFSTAESTYREALVAFPGYVAAYRGLGLVYAKTQRPGDAITAWSKYLELAPQARDAWLVRKRMARVQRGLAAPAATAK